MVALLQQEAVEVFVAGRGALCSHHSGEGRMLPVGGGAYLWHVLKAKSQRCVQDQALPDRTINCLMMSRLPRE